MSDQAARDFAVRNTDQTLLVEAGAGTGKTTLLVERICALIEKGVSPEKIAAVTFTVKAAGEMKQRLRERLNKSGSALACEALKNLDRMSVSTIHSMAAEMLRTLPVEANLPPEFIALDQLQGEAIRDEFITTWLLQALDKPTPPSFSIAALFGLELLKSEDKGLKSLFRTMSIVKCDLNLLDTGEVSAEEIQNALPDIEAHVVSLAHFATDCKDHTDELYRIIANLTQWFQVKPISLNSQSGAEWIVSADTGSKGRGVQRNWSTKEILAAAKESRNQLDDLLAKVKQQLFSNACADIIRWLTPAVNEYRRQLQELGTIGFDEQLLLCRDMLLQSHTARDYFKSRFEHIHVDEFQDTDPVQVDILFFLAERNKEHADSWQKVNLEPGKLFLVGDPKQSIYRFRGADVRIYNEVAKQIEASGKKLLITRNFRSRPAILSEVNALFADHMRGSNEYEAHYVALEPGENAPNDPNALELLFPPANYDGTGARRSATNEANAIADHLQKLMQLDPELNLSEVAILLRSGTKESILLRALSARNIPFISFINSAFPSRVEIESLLTFLTAIANPQHTVAVIGSLRSPMLAVSDDELFEHKFSGRTFVYTDSQPEGTAAGLALGNLLKWHIRSKHIGAAQLVEELLTELPLEIVYGLKSDGVQRVHNVQLFVELVRRLEQCGVNSLSEIVERISSMAKLVQATELEARDESRKSVQVLSLHKAKGLEFKYVYLYAFDDKSKTPKNWLLQESAGADRPQIGLKAEMSQTANFESITKSGVLAETAERARLLYVGMTRAKQKLIIPIGWACSKKNVPLIPAVLAKRYANVQVGPTGTSSTDAVKTTGSIGQITDFKPYAIQSKIDIGDAGKSVEAFRAWQDSLRTRITALQSAPPQIEDVEDKLVTDWTRVRARKIGTYVHGVLEQLAQKQNIILAEQLVSRKMPLTDDELSDAKTILALVAQSALFTTELPQARRIITELPIVENHDDSVTAKFVDLMFQRTNGDWVLLDYKTDDIPAEAVESRKEDHRRQIEDYARMFERVMGKPPAEKRLYFVRPNVTAFL